MQNRLLILIILSTLILLGGFPVQSFAQNFGVNSCHTLFENNQTSKENVESKLNTKLNVFVRLDDEAAGVRDYSIRIRDNREVYAIALFSFYEDIANTEIIQMRVYSPYKKLGLGSLMMEEILKTLPKTEAIIVRGLKDDNLEVLEKYLKEGYSQIDAIKKTPAYKIRAKFGFSEIIRGTITIKDGFSVRKKN